MSVCWAMVRKITIGAPPGTMMNGRRAPNLKGPKLCNSEPSPHIRNVALIRLTVMSEARLSVLPIRKTAVIGEAAITSTCCNPRRMSRCSGNISSTGCTRGTAADICSLLVIDSQAKTMPKHNYYRGVSSFD